MTFDEARQELARAAPLLLPDEDRARLAIELMKADAMQRDVALKEAEAKRQETRDARRAQEREENRVALAMGQAIRDGQVDPGDLAWGLVRDGLRGEIP